MDFLLNYYFGVWLVNMFVFVDSIDLGERTDMITTIADLTNASNITNVLGIRTHESTSMKLVNIAERKDDQLGPAESISFEVDSSEELLSSVTETYEGSAKLPPHWLVTASRHRTVIYKNGTQL